MRVFILCTGRCGSTAFIKACQQIRNYSAAHESLSRAIGEARLNYADQHIEADNRLSWFLGSLDKKFGDEAIYVHLKRDIAPTAASFSKRFNYKNSIIDYYTKSVLMLNPNLLNEEEKLNICYDYVHTVNNNIELFLKNKSRVLIVNLESVKEDFVNFWNFIGAEGDLEAALCEFDIVYNASKSRNTLKNWLHKFYSHK